MNLAYYTQACHLQGCFDHFNIQLFCYQVFVLLKAFLISPDVVVVTPQILVVEALYNALLDKNRTVGNSFFWRLQILWKFRRWCAPNELFV